MSEFQHKRSEVPKMSAAARARGMLCEVAGPRGWDDTRESWLARGARRAGLTLRRARALFYQEPIRLSADEYLAIERAYQAAHAAVATIADLARAQALRASDRDGAASPGADSSSRSADAGERGGPAGTPAAR